MELADNKAELIEALKTSSGWTPENHRHFAAGFRDRVRTVLLVAKAKGWELPSDGLFKVFAALAGPALDAPKPPPETPDVLQLSLSEAA